jgi:hypothetical protein
MCKLPVIQFTYEKSVQFRRVSIFDIFGTDGMPKHPWIGIGYCDARLLDFRTKPDGIAVMFQNDKTYDTVWMHMNLAEAKSVWNLTTFEGVV